MASLVMINVWAGIPFFTINLLAGLKAIDKEYYEAAIIDGASAWRCFLHVTLPSLRYVIIVATLLSTIWTFNSFDMIFLLTGGSSIPILRVVIVVTVGGTASVLMDGVDALQRELETLRRR